MEIVRLFPLYDFMKADAKNSIFGKIIFFLFPLQVLLQVFAMILFVLVGHSILATVATIFSAAIFALSFSSHWNFYHYIQKQPKLFVFEADIGTGYYPHFWIFTNSFMFLLLLGGSKDLFLVTFMSWIVMIIIAKLRWR